MDTPEAGAVLGIVGFSETSRSNAFCPSVDT